jgi:DNA-directed RNA polymerase subunit M/transcription elongation factor TFIIS
MAGKNLKPEQYYNDLYDRFTVDVCRRHIEYNDKRMKELDLKDPEAKLKKSFSKMFLELRLYSEKGERYLDKKETVRKWMQVDQKRDDLLESVVPPRGISCLKCGSIMKPDSGTIYDWDEGKKDRVLFMYDCPSLCRPARAFFNDGEEYRVKPLLCPKCDGELTFAKEKFENKIIIHYSCKLCGHKYDDELDFTPKKETVDDNFVKDRELYCFTEEQGQEYLSGKNHLIAATDLINESRKKEENKEVYGQVDKIKKLTLVELEKLVTPILEREGYIQLKFGNPEIGKDLIVPFTINDSKSGREKMASEYDIKHTLKKTLEDTNWRLMSDGVSYRLGILSGRFRGYESEEDLLKLIK